MHPLTALVDSPWVQVLLVSFVFFTTVGMFQAIGNLGAGGTQSESLHPLLIARQLTCFSLIRY